MEWYVDYCLLPISSPKKNQDGKEIGVLLAGAQLGISHSVMVSSYALVIEASELKAPCYIFQRVKIQNDI